MIIETYKVIKAMTVWGFQKQCNKMLKEGYKAQGGPLRSWGFFYQAFIK